MINGPPWRGQETGKTERAAIQGWGPTLRLLTLRAAATAPWLGLLQTDGGANLLAAAASFM